MAVDTQVVDAEQLIVQHLDLWTSAQTAKSTAGRGSNNKIELTGIKKLRELILELAVRGKLVPQDPNDEPASELLKRVEEEKESLARTGMIKKQKHSMPITDAEMSFELPIGWEWCRLADIYLRLSNGFSGKQNKDGIGYPFTRIETISAGCVNYDKVGFCSDLTEKQLSDYILLPGDILISHINSDYHLGKTAIYNGEAILYHGVNLLLLRLSSNLESQYVELYFNHLRTKGYFLEIAQHAIGQASINQSKLNVVPLAIPPLNEQKKIVQRCEQLFTLIDELEQQSYQSIDAHNQLVDTLLQTLVDSANADELASNWQRLSEHFDTLFTTEYSIDALKQTILQLAVMGKLVKQDPTDEPASELLKRIAKEKEALVKAGKIKKQKPLPPITDNEKPFELPKGWEWCRLPDLGELSRGKSKHRPRNDPRLFKDGSYPLVQTGDVARADKLITSYASTYNDFGLAQSRLWPIGTLCITIAANIADTGILGIEACFPDSVVGYLPYSQNMPVEYFDYFIKVTKDDLERFAPSTAQKNINLEILGDLLVPCPPEDEIRRIVSKVEDLFNLCDNAKSKILESNNTQAVLAEALVEQNV